MLPSTFRACEVTMVGTMRLSEFTRDGTTGCSTADVPEDPDAVPGPRYPLRRFAFFGGEGSAPLVAAELLAYEALPPDEAVALLHGDDRTGMKVWGGCTELARWALLQCGSRGGGGSSGSGEFDSFLLRAPTGVVELGCGAGLVSITLAAAFRKRLAFVAATDGLEDCVELAAANITWNRVDDLAVALPYVWGTEAQARAINFKGATQLAIFAADVIYATDAIEPFVRAVSQLRDISRAPAVRLFFCFVPRALTTDENKKNFEILLRGLARRGWCVGHAVALEASSPGEPTQVESQRQGELQEQQGDEISAMVSALWRGCILVVDHHDDSSPA